MGGTMQAGKVVAKLVGQRVAVRSCGRIFPIRLEPLHA